MSGHSFGGVTALLAGTQDEKVKAVLTNDPWLKPIADKILSD